MPRPAATRKERIHATEVVLLDLESLTLDPNNARQHPERNLRDIARSLELHGQRKPIVVQRRGRGRKAELVVRAGNGTVQALRHLGWSQVAAVVIAEDDEAAVRYAIADNRTAESATWDDAALAGALQGLSETDLGTDGTGFDEAEVASILARLEASAPGEDEGAAEDPEAIPDPPRKPVTETGDLWLLGSHRLLCGESDLDEDVIRLLGDRTRVDLVVTDPPYAIYGSSTGIGRDIADDSMVVPFFEQLCRRVAAALPLFAHAYVFTDWRSWSALWTAARRTDLVAKNCVVWSKCNAGLGSMYAQTHEFIGFFVRESPAKTLKAGKSTGHRPVLQPNVITMPRVTHEAREHNAAKPVALLEQLIQNSSDPGHVVLDLYAGSGSTLIAAERTARACLAMDHEPKCCDVIVRRWQRETGQRARRFGLDGVERGGVE